jgi:hypothetical protein
MLLRRIAQDEDIHSDNETLHPAWESVYRSSEQALKRIISREDLNLLGSFFEEMSPYDAEIKSIDPREQVITFLLGAGASKPAPSNIPTVAELLPQLLDRARRLDREEVTRLADYCDQRKINNIEDLLTAAQLATFCSRNGRVLTLTNYLLYRGGEEAPTLGGPAAAWDRERRFRYGPRSSLDQGPAPIFHQRFSWRTPYKYFLVYWPARCCPPNPIWRMKQLQPTRGAMRHQPLSRRIMIAIWILRSARRRKISVIESNLRISPRSRRAVEPRSI